VAFNATPGEIVIDTRARKLFFTIDDRTAYAYPISVGRDGFRWAGTETISRVATWPDWHPPREMRQRDPTLPVKMTGGLRNPLGAVALYLGDSLYRIHGTNDKKSIGRASSSGCFRMLNEHAAHLAQLAGPGTVVKVLPHLPTGMLATDLDTAEKEKGGLKEKSDRQTAQPPA
jgi:lipoprotein-anchoring transpeptidase ErfK/SrfK